MYTIKLLIIGIFVALLFVNIYFRLKVIKHYKYLVQNRVQFDASDIFNRSKIEAIIQKYPEHSFHIEGFTGHIRRSILIAIGLVLLITIMGVLLRSN